MIYFWVFTSNIVLYAYVGVLRLVEQVLLIFLFLFFLLFLLLHNILFGWCLLIWIDVLVLERTIKQIFIIFVLIIELLMNVTIEDVLEGVFLFVIFQQIVFFWAFTRQFFFGGRFLEFTFLRRLFQPASFESELVYSADVTKFRSVEGSIMLQEDSWYFLSNCTFFSQKLIIYFDEFLHLINDFCLQVLLKPIAALQPASLAIFLYPFLDVLFRSIGIEFFCNNVSEFF